MKYRGMILGLSLVILAGCGDGNQTGELSGDSHSIFGLGEFRATALVQNCTDNIPLTQSTERIRFSANQMAIIRSEGEDCTKSMVFGISTTEEAIVVDSFQRVSVSDQCRDVEKAEQMLSSFGRAYIGQILKFQMSEQGTSLALSFDFERCEFPQSIYTKVSE